MQQNATNNCVLFLCKITLYPSGSPTLHLLNQALTGHNRAAASANYPEPLVYCQASPDTRKKQRRPCRERGVTRIADLDPKMYFNRIIQKILGFWPWQSVSASDCTLVRWRWLAALIALVTLVALITPIRPVTPITPVMLVTLVTLATLITLVRLATPTTLFTLFTLVTL